MTSRIDYALPSAVTQLYRRVCSQTNGIESTAQPYGDIYKRTRFVNGSSTGDAEQNYIIGIPLDKPALTVRFVGGGIEGWRPNGMFVLKTALNKRRRVSDGGR
jgi:hypothetical protein